jgi:hypothetical protein
VKNSASIRILNELIAALHRRLPGVQNAREVAIARDAQALEAKARTRIAELEREPGGVACR